MDQVIFSFRNSLLSRGIGWRKSLLRSVSYLALPVFLLPLASYAQINTGGIIGRVTDPSGAVVPNAKVALTNQQTGIKVETDVNQTGDFAFRGLPPGTYRIDVTSAGFAAFAETNIPVAVAETSTHDVKLSVGGTSTAVSVTADTVALDTGSATLGTLVEQKEVVDLPLNGRNFTELLLVTAGVTSAGTDAQWGNPQSGDYRQPSINGQSQNTQHLPSGRNEQYFQLYLWAFRYRR